MRLGAGVIVLGAVSAAAAGVGCIGPLAPTERAGNPAGTQTFSRSLTPAVAAEGLIVQSILLERPIGDQFLDRDLWAATIPAGPPETRALLSENGLRAGILTGQLPQRFQDLLVAEAETVDPHVLTFNMRKEAVVPTAGPVDPCKFSVLADLGARPRPVELKRAQCGFLVKPHLAETGGVRLWCEPQIQHGERRDGYRPTEDGTKFTRYEEIPLEKFSEFGFEVTLGADDCFVLGWSADQPDTLGAVLFGVEADNRPRQRVLVLRARQLARPGSADLPTIVGPMRRR